ncbi:copper ion binding protein [Mobilisporobacter senegalensis]|uniref:Copper ion binding protein n=1 Tax=Mobilisporobacter senegalensis TaxID=1329262 RepID=A0A3N1XV13_9FIRM|nr:heavy-metal-associated domain-containing protein [Mobilisporobacter senegalensis]ROR30460.1 copper ion binding protein [Mobilisporobacter senegalensis]
MTKKISIEGMSCSHCVNHVKESLEELNGVTKVDVDLDTKSAVLESSEDIKDEDIKSAIDEVGYEVVEIQVI